VAGDGSFGCVAHLMGDFSCHATVYLGSYNGQAGNPPVQLQVSVGHKAE
jgi:hypothetical protein